LIDEGVLEPDFLKVIFVGVQAFEEPGGLRGTQANRYRRPD